MEPKQNAAHTHTHEFTEWCGPKAVAGLRVCVCWPGVFLSRQPKRRLRFPSYLIEAERERERSALGSHGADSRVCVGAREKKREE